LRSQIAGDPSPQPSPRSTGERENDAAGARIADITEADLADVGRFLARQSPPAGQAAPTSESTLRRLRWLLLDNPARLQEVPFGWCLRDTHSNAVVGAMLSVPLRLAGGGLESPRVGLMSCKFFVDEPYRGLGLGLFMRYLKAGARGGHPLFCTTANRASGELWERFGGYAIPGTDHEMISVANFAPLAEEWFHRRVGRAALARVLAAPARFWTHFPPLWRRALGNALVPLQSADEAAAVIPPEAGGAVAVARDRDYLHWRYFAGPDERAVFRYEGRDEPPRLVLSGIVRRGYRGQIRSLTVLDVFPATTPNSAADLADELAARHPEQFDVLAVRTQPPAVEVSLKPRFRRHEYPAPLGWCIDRSNALPTRQWYLMPGEAE
jgi:hypothetical protein